MSHSGVFVFAHTQSGCVLQVFTLTSQHLRTFRRTSWSTCMFSVGQWSSTMTTTSSGLRPTWTLWYAHVLIVQENFQIRAAFSLKGFSKYFHLETTFQRPVVIVLFLHISVFMTICTFPLYKPALILPLSSGCSLPSLWQLPNTNEVKSTEVKTL